MIVDTGKIKCGCGQDMLFGYEKDENRILAAHKGIMVVNMLDTGYVGMAEAGNLICNKIQKYMSSNASRLANYENCLPTWFTAAAVLQSLMTRAADMPEEWEV